LGRRQPEDADPGPDQVQIDRLMALAYGFASDEADDSVLEAIERITGAPSRIVLRGPAAPTERAAAAGRDADVTEKGHRYRIGAVLGGGDVGVVFEGRDTDLGRNVAVKVLRREHAADESLVRRFLEEAQLEAQLQHPGIVPVYGLGLERSGRPYFVMKLVRGDSLATLLAQREVPGPDRRRFVDIFEQVSHAVAYAHARGVVHRDLNPANIMVGSFREVHVVDWGLANVLGAEEDTAVELSSATPAYLAPEQARGEVAKIDERADVFALGAVLCTILTGRPPYLGEREDQLAQAVDGRVEAAYARLDACGADPELVVLAKRCLAPQRESRPRNAGVVAQAVQAYLNASEERARRAELAAAEERTRAEKERAQEDLARRKEEWERLARRRTATIAACVLVAVLVGSLIYLLKDRADRTRAARTKTQVNQALSKASQRESDGDWGDAQAWAKRALALAEAGKADTSTLRRARTKCEEIRKGEEAAQQAAQREAEDAAMLADLDEIRTQFLGGHGSGARALDDAYAKAFAKYGIDLRHVEEAAVAIKSRSTTAELATALDDWAWLRERYGRGSGYLDLMRIARLADPDAWRDRLRTQRDWLQLGKLRALAVAADPAEAPVHSLLMLARLLDAAGDPAAAQVLLREAQRHRPANIWINYRLGAHLVEDRPQEALRFWSAALAVRPGFGCVWHEVGLALQRQEKFGLALAAHRRAAGCQPDHAGHHAALAALLRQRGALAEAAAALRRALKTHRDAATLHRELARTLTEAGDAKGARVALRAARAHARRADMARARINSVLFPPAGVEGAADWCSRVLVWDAEVLGSAGGGGR
jgi:serine/threonine-protein kinase